LLFAPTVRRSEVPRVRQIVVVAESVCAKSRLSSREGNAKELDATTTRQVVVVAGRKCSAASVNKQTNKSRCKAPQRGVPNLIGAYSLTKSGFRSQKKERKKERKKKRIDRSD